MQRGTISLAVNRIAPNWRALGYEDRKGLRFLWFEIEGRPRAFNVAYAGSVTFLLELYQDAQYWRAHFPIGQGHGIDKRAAQAYFIRACLKAGNYIPKPE